MRNRHAGNLCTCRHYRVDKDPVVVGLPVTTDYLDAIMRGVQIAGRRPDHDCDTVHRLQQSHWVVTRLLTGCVRLRPCARETCVH